MFVQSFFVPGLAHLSYLLGGKKACAMVDPQALKSIGWIAPERGQSRNFN